MQPADVASPLQILQEWEDQSTDINAVLEGVDHLVEMINGPTPEKLRRLAKEIWSEDLFVTLHLSIAGLQEWHERFQQADKEAEEAISKGSLPAANQRELVGIRARADHGQIVSVRVAKTADARRLRKEVMNVIEAIQRVRSLTRAVEALLGRKTVVDRVGQMLNKVEITEEIDETLGVESIASFGSG
ncbi:hypothetical protein Slin15195_G018600 [Septoria linicola]|uniref:Uncharacterized protein n=1 Tax=Septoria linicola TaxID=215465 RepID=A0A9Q9EE92_9PEZI|nr:hypothetical protein Slin14017_G018680 [Septoria linicola]USW48541.1 hypothetical protein Slin15195_G018600 [Septoria linicola]